MAGKLKGKSKELQKALHEIPYLGTIIQGGELASLAFEFMKENTPDRYKAEAAGTWSKVAGGRITAFENWLKEAWSGDTKLTTIVGDYLDYLSLFH